MRRRGATALLLVGILGAATGCSGANDDPDVGAASVTDRDVPADDYQIDDVEDPLDLTAYETDPCGLVAAAAFDDAETTVIPDVGCSVSAADDVLSGLIVGVRFGGGLQSFYDSYRRSSTGSWRPIEVSGYPGALLGDEQSDMLGACVAVVAVAEDQFVRVEASDPDGDAAAACDRASTAADRVIAEVSTTSSGD